MGDLERTLEFEDRLEQAGIEFYHRVFEGYRELALLEPNRIKVIDAGQNINEIQKQIINLLEV